MFTLDKTSTARDVMTFVELCIELNVKTVFVDSDVMDIINQIKKGKFSYLILSKVQFFLNADHERFMSELSESSFV